MVTPVTYKSLWIQILLISIIGYGGGAAVIPLFHKVFVEEKKWFNEEDFQNILTVSNTLPGPIQTKIAGYIGYKTKGLIGLILSVITIISPSLLLMLLFFETIKSFQYEPWVNGAISGIYPVITVMMGLLVFQFAVRSIKKIQWKSLIVILLIDLFALYLLQIHPAWLIIITIVTSFLYRFKESFRFSIILTFILIIYVIQTYVSINFMSFNMTNIDSLSESLKLIFAFIIPGSIGYGGGPGSLSLISYEVVEHFNLVSASDFGLAVAIQSALPGVTATKLAGTIGFQVFGIAGLLLSILAYVLPSLTLMIILLNLLNKYKNHPVVNLMTSLLTPIIMLLLFNLVLNFYALSIFNQGYFIALLFMISAFLVIKVLKVHPFFVIILFMTLGGIISL